MASYRKHYYRNTQSKSKTIEFGLDADVYQQFKKESDELYDVEVKISKGFVYPKFINNLLPKFVLGTLVLSIMMSSGSYYSDPIYVRFSWIVCIAIWAGVFFLNEQLFVLLNPSLFRMKTDLSSFLEKKRLQLLRERQGRPFGFQTLSLQTYSDIKSALNTPLNSETIGKSCVYHIAMQGWDLTQGYVGVSTNYFNRRNQHFRALREGDHENAKLQRAFNEYGDKLKMRVLHNGVSEYESYSLESRYRPEPNMALNIRRGGR